ncbi:ribbon-helix-helix protein, CopG family [Nocardia cyriacigeorgica]|uniref:ribbon-helix-helix protein, CopG family n=1 Tax=Nocardia cyriacigeorgica TaxID=135487 RepID=UPI0006627C03|nr:ribbon-helix-helix protein, CopG family [Nocardia cyriacigeorgica]
MAMTLRLSDEQAAALRRRAEAEHTSMQQVALAAIDNYVNQPTGQGRRRAVPVDELLAAFGDLPPMNLDRFRADQDEHIDDTARFDAYLRGQDVGESE